MDQYSQIINLPHHRSKTHPPMSMSDRAAQFAPFATLSGHEDAIAETERLTEEWIPPDEESTQLLDLQTMHLSARIDAGEQPSVTVTYFQPDEKKSGGCYQTRSGRLRRIDETAGVFRLIDGTGIAMQYITKIEEYG